MTRTKTAPPDEVPDNVLGGLSPVDAQPAQGDLRLWAVTGIIGVLDKPGLVYWSAEQTAKAAVAAHKSLPARLQEDGEEETIKWLCGARFRRIKGHRTGAELGTAFHDGVEEYGMTGIKPDVDDELRPFLDRFDEWAQRAQPEYEATEVTVYHPEFGYAGTLDAIMTVGGIRCLADYKTTVKNRNPQGKLTMPYPEQVGLQLAAYRYATHAAVWRPRKLEQQYRRYYLLGTDEQDLAVPVPEVDTGLVIHVTPERCEAYPIRCDEDVFEAFLHVQEAAHWVHEASKHVMGDPLEFEGDR